MKVFDLYSKRKKRERGEVIDIFTYDEIPKSLLVQIVHIWRDAFPEDDYSRPHLKLFYKEIYDILCREYGMFRLNGTSGKLFSLKTELETFLQTCEDNEKVLSVIELSFQFVDSEIRKDYKSDLISDGKVYNSKTERLVKISPTTAINELNVRFLEHGVGYHFESGQIIRKDSEIVHQEAVKPVLNFLSSPKYKGANEEFLKAHEHYRHKRYKESVNECLKSFESVMKTICNKHKWTYDEKDTAKKLIEICFSNGLIPNYLQSQFSALKAVFESGIPTARNKTSGHGQGITQAVVPDYFARYVLNLTATTILFLVEAEKELP